MLEAQLIETVQRMLLEPGDVLVARASVRLAPEAMDRLRDVLRALTRDLGVKDVRIVILDPGMSLETVAGA